AGVGRLAVMGADAVGYAPGPGTGVAQAIRKAIWMPHTGNAAAPKGGMQSRTHLIKYGIHRNLLFCRSNTDPGHLTHGHTHHYPLATVGWPPPFSCGRRAPHHFCDGADALWESLHLRALPHRVLATPPDCIVPH